MNIKEEIHNHFKDDRLFMYLKTQGFLEKQLSPDFLDAINIEKLYSTVEVAEMLYISDNDLRYCIKIMRAIGYIKSIKAGRNHRFNYLQCYQLYLVVSILNLPQHTTADIKKILGYSVDTVPLNQNSTCSLPDQGQILKLQYEITATEQKLNAEYRAYLQFDSKFNLMLIENKYANDIKELSKTVKSSWFSRNTNESLQKNESHLDLMTLKDQLLEVQTNISDFEMDLKLKMKELKQIVDDQLNSK